MNGDDRRRVIKRFFFPVTMLKNIEGYYKCVQLRSEADRQLMRLPTFNIGALKFLFYSTIFVG